MIRPTWDEYFLDMVVTAGKRGNCDRGRVGAVIVVDRHVASTGYVGAPAGCKTCDEVGHLMKTVYDERGGTHQHCVAGDTVISKFQVRHYNFGHRTIEEIYDQWNHPRKQGPTKLMKIRSSSSTHIIVPDQIIDVWKSESKQQLYQVTTRFGRSVRLTSDHLMLSPRGWIKVSDLIPGKSKIGLNGVSVIDNPKWLKRKYTEEERTQNDIAGLANCSRFTVNARLLKFGIKKRVFHPAGWNRGLRRGGSHNYKGDDVSPRVARGRAHRYYHKDQCELCGNKGNLHTHHRDNNVWNDHDDNLITLCTCHELVHHIHAKRQMIVFDLVTEVTKIGKDYVYDLTTAKYHNFIGNGIILHNCVRTTHAEANAIAQAARYGTAINGGTVYCKMTPCLDCTKLLINAGIKRVVTLKRYHADHDSIDVLKEAGIDLVVIDNEVEKYNNQ
jgi:deoxycytidylate deaminase